MNFHQKITNKPANWRNDRLHFFKYMSSETAEIVLSTRKLRWSTPRMLNDLYDVQIDLGLNINEKLLVEIAHDRMWEVISGQTRSTHQTIITQALSRLRTYKKYKSKADFIADMDGAVLETLAIIRGNLEETQAEIRNNFRNEKILCLTEDPTNPPMWAHYANQDTGVVLRFRSIVATDTPYGMASQMQYLDTLPSIMDESQIANELVGIRESGTQRILDKMTYSKGKAWAYEKEWRVTAGSGRNPEAEYEDIPFGLNDIDGVILGIRMNEDDRKKIIDHVQRYPNIELMEARKSSSGFHHEIVELSR